MKPLASFHQIPDTEGDVIRKEKMGFLLSKLMRSEDVLSIFTTLTSNQRLFPHISLNVEFFKEIYTFTAPY